MAWQMMLASSKTFQGRSTTPHGNVGACGSPQARRCPAWAPNGAGSQMRVLRWNGHDTGARFLNAPRYRSALKVLSG